MVNRAIKMIEDTHLKQFGVQLDTHIVEKEEDVPTHNPKFGIYLDRMIGRPAWDKVAPVLKKMYPFCKGHVFHVFLHDKEPDLMEFNPPEKYPSGIYLNLIQDNRTKRDIFHINVSNADLPASPLLSSIERILQ